MRTRMTAIGALALAAALTLTGCTTPGSVSGMGTADNPTATNVNDQMFVMMMIPHHQQAIEMSDAVLAADGIAPDVVDLATRITAAQQPEIETMQGWLDDWGLPDMMTGMDHGTGMMSDDDLDALRSATGVELERLFLTQMIEHHQGAIEMAQDEIDDGSDPDVVALARAILTAQTAEIAEMTTMLESR